MLDAIRKKLKRSKCKNKALAIWEHVILMEGSGKEKSLKKENKAHRRACSRAWVGVCARAGVPMRICMHIYRSLQVCVHAWPLTQSNVRGCACARAREYMCMCLCTPTWACMHVSTPSCVCLSARACLCTCTCVACACVPAHIYASVRACGYMCVHLARLRISKGLSVHSCVSTHAHMWVRSYTSVHALRVSAQTRAWACIPAWARMLARANASECESMCACVCVCTHMQINVQMCVHLCK